MGVKPGPEEALKQIQEAAAEGKVLLADDTLCESLDSEIQEIYTTIRLIETGKPPKRPIWASDEVDIGIVMDLTPEGQVTDKSKAHVRLAGEQLGISLSVSDLWVEAALRLRNLRSEANN